MKLELRRQIFDIANRYELKGPGIKFRWRCDFPYPSNRGPPSLLYNGYRIFPGGDAAGPWRWPPIPNYRPG